MMGIIVKWGRSYDEKICMGRTLPCLLERVFTQKTTLIWAWLRLKAASFTISPFHRLPA
jgi:hypothetical protein